MLVPKTTVAVVSAKCSAVCSRELSFLNSLFTIRFKYKAYSRALFLFYNILLIEDQLRLLPKFIRLLAYKFGKFPG